MVTVGVLLTGCSGGGSQAGTIDRDHGIPIRASELHGAGTPLPDVFVVPPGTVLAGAVLPRRPGATFDGRPLNERSWTATLGVGVAPRAVAIALLEQAKAARVAGLPAEPWCDRHACGFSAGWVSSPPSGRSISVQVGTQRHQGTFASVRFDDFGGPDPGASARGGVPSGSGIPHEPRDRAPGALASTGDPIGLHDWSVSVAAGSEMVMPVVSPMGPHEAILRVTGDPASVYRAYVRQLAARTPGLAPTRLADARIDGWTLKTTEDGEFGSRAVDLLTRHGRAYIRLTAVED